MKKYHKFVCKHKRATAIIYSLIAGVVGSFFAFLVDYDIFIIILIIIGSTLAIAAHINNCQINPINYTIKLLDNYCDPIPLLDVSSFLLDCKNNKFYNNLFIINHCVSLQELGETEKAYNLLKTINIEDKGINTQIKYIYFHNLSSFYTILNEYKLANEAYETSSQVLNAIKSKKIKGMFEKPSLSAAAMHQYRKENYNEVISILEKIQDTPLRANIHNALLCAKAYIKLGDMEKAKDNLMYVIVNGNKLACVNEARELLKETPYSNYSNLFSTGKIQE